MKKKRKCNVKRVYGIQLLVYYVYNLLVYSFWETVEVRKQQANAGVVLILHERSKLYFARFILLLPGDSGGD